MPREKRERGERPGDLRQEMNRVRNAKNHLKDVCRDKTAMNKKLRDRNVELTENRDKWKIKSKELEDQLETAQKEVERERKRADHEQERAEKLRAEIETVLEKKMRTREFNSPCGRERAS